MTKPTEFFKGCLVVKDSFIANVLTLMTATAVAEVIPFILSPIVARIYSPEDFGALAICMAFVCYMSIIVTGKYELAITIPENDKEALDITALCVILVLFVTAIVFLLAWLFTAAGVTGRFSYLFYFVPLIAFLAGLNQVFMILSIRKQRYNVLSKVKIAGTLVSSSTKIGAGLCIPGPGGLFLGEILGRAAVLLKLISASYKDFKAGAVKPDISGIKKAAVRYRQFPKYSIIANLISTSSENMPIFLFSVFFGIHVAGLYAFVQKILSTPLTLISGSMLDVFRQKASEDFLKYGSCRGALIKLLKYILFLCAVPFILIFFFAPQMFAVAFGEVWREAGEYAQLLSIVFLFKFISPLTYVAYIAEKQEYDLIWQSFLFVFICMAIAAGVYFNDVKLSLKLFSCVYFVMYTVYFFIMYHIAKKDDND